ncbi:MAG TPA: vWA domain-containing protein [Kofleriaceae bacterium]|jgi:hypothetical protein
MPIRQRLVTYGIPSLAAATVVTAALLHPWRAAPAPQIESDPYVPIPHEAPTPPPASHTVDVVFAIDTTGSMGGLLDGARRTVWSIATHIREADPNADVRIGLVAYKDVGDEYTSYITKDFPLTTDIDGVFRELSSYTADGGGDTPEDVNKALDDAMHMQWRAGAKKLVFLVGDAPPADRHDAPTFDVIARDAGTRGILINTIRCGWDRDTQSAWSEIASLSGGQFQTIAQDGGVQQVATPYDAKLAELSAKVDETTVVTGTEVDRAAYHAAMGVAAAAPAAAKADRASYYAAKGGGRAAGDLVEKYSMNGSAALDGLEGDALPDDLRGKDSAALKQELDKRLAERRATEAELKKVVTQRADYLKNLPAPRDGFDAKVNATIDAELK